MAHAQFPNKKNKTNAKQVHLPLTAYVGLVNLPIPANASNFSIDVPISTLLATAGRGGQPVPKQTSTSHDVEGIVLTQRVIVRKTSNLEPTTVQSEEVFGLITLATGLYVITFYIINGTTGAQTQVTIPADNYNLEFAYNFALDLLPNDFAVNVLSKTFKDADNGQGKRIAEQLTIASLNTVPALTLGSIVPNTPVELVVNGVVYDTLPTSGVTAAATTVTWTAATVGFDLETTDRVVAYYNTL